MHNCYFKQTQNIKPFLKCKSYFTMYLILLVCVCGIGFDFAADRFFKCKMPVLIYLLYLILRLYLFIFFSLAANMQGSYEKEALISAGLPFCTKQTRALWEEKKKE